MQFKESVPDLPQPLVMEVTVMTKILKKNGWGKIFEMHFRIQITPKITSQIR